jgi:hypothetical protein
MSSCTFPDMNICRKNIRLTDQPQVGMHQCPDVGMSFVVAGVGDPAIECDEGGGVAQAVFADGQVVGLPVRIASTVHGRVEQPPAKPGLALPGQFVPAAEPSPVLGHHHRQGNEGSDAWNALASTSACRDPGSVRLRVGPGRQYVSRKPESPSARKRPSLVVRPRW